MGAVEIPIKDCSYKRDPNPFAAGRQQHGLVPHVVEPSGLDLQGS